MAAYCVDMVGPHYLWEFPEALWIRKSVDKFKSVVLGLHPTLSKSTRAVLW